MRKTVPWLATFTLLALIGTRGGIWLQEQLAIADLPDSTPDAPNVLVLVVDTLRADHLASYGYERATSPNLDRIASESVLFKNAISTSAYTLPSHVSLMTGRFTYEHNVEWADPKAFFESPYPTLAEELRSRGYRTAAFTANLFWFTREFGFGRGFIHFDDYFHSIEDSLLRTAFGRIFQKIVLPRLGFEDLPGRKPAADVNEAALKWLESSPEKPFFVFLNYMDTHDPYVPPEPYRSQFSSSNEPGGILNCFLERCQLELSSEELQSEIDAYDGAIAYVDEHIGKLFDELEKRGLIRNTLVAILSDHGEAFGEHGIYLHDNSLYREVLHVPMMFRWPGQLPERGRVSTPVSIASLPATIMDLVDGSGRSVFPGPSLAALWEEQTSALDWPSPIAEMVHKPWAPEEYPVAHGDMRSLVTPRWHYIENEGLGIELFDWSTDPLEKNELSEEPDLRAARDRLETELRQTLLTIRSTEDDMLARAHEDVR